MSDLTSIFKAAPLAAIPTMRAKQALQLLTMLSSGEPVTEIEQAKQFRHPRSPLQALGRDDFQYWLIHPINDDNGVIVARQLDSRHLSGDPAQDAAARAERRKVLKEESNKIVQQNLKRKEKAQADLMKALQNYYEVFGEAANDAVNSDSPLAPPKKQKPDS